jgi:Family of unknown function (DUF6056)
MPPSLARALRWSFLLYAAATALHLGWVTYHEPFSFDAWNFAVATEAKPVTVGRFFGFWADQYFGSNPRFGQPFAYLSYKVVGFAEVGTPLAYFALVLGCFVLGVGRWPQWRRGRDVAALAVATGFLWFASPSLPMVMFCRAYSTNYVWAAAIQLWFLVPARLYLVHGDAHRSSRGLPAPSAEGKPSAFIPAARGPAQVDQAAVALGGPARLRGPIAYGLLGVCAGMSNEHTGPTLVALSAGLALWAWRRWKQPARLLVAGAIGVFVGFALIFFAPGQGQRYDGLAEQATLGERLLQRGFGRNLDILQQYLGGAAPILLLAALVAVVGVLGGARGVRRSDDGAAGAEADARALTRRLQLSAIRTFGLALAFGVAVTVTIFVSPKLGPRFYLHSCLALLAGFLGLADAFLDHAWGKRLLGAFVALALVASGYAVHQTVPLYANLARESAERLRRLEAAPRRAVITVDSFSQVPMSWWFLGDDFRDRNKRDLVAKYFGLRRVILRGGDGDATLGVTDVRLRFRAVSEPAGCVDELPGLSLPQLGGRDVAAMQHAFADVVTEIGELGDALPGGCRLRRLDLEVQFEGERPATPEPRVYVASWRDGESLAFAATVLRVGASRQRQVTPPKTLRQADWDIHAFAVGHGTQKLGTSKQEAPLRYTPERFRQYWALACRPGECFVMSARR